MCINDVRCVCETYSRRAKGRTTWKTGERGELGEHERRNAWRTRETSRAGGKERKGIRARWWKRRVSMEKERSSETYKDFRITETHGRSICNLYMPAVFYRPAVSIEITCFFFPEAPCRVSTRLDVVSRKRLPDYVCPATDGDTDERLIYRATYITGSKTAATPLLLLLLLLLLFFPCFFIVLFVSVDRPVCLPLSRLYIDRHRLVDVSVRPPIHSS